MENKRFDGRVAVISGSGGGLGREYALLLAARGCKVVVNDLGTNRHGQGRDMSMAQDVVDEILASGGEAIANGDTVATAEGANAMVQTALDTWGRIDILIHNATINRHARFQDLAFTDFSAVLDVHLMGAFHLAKAAFPHMCAAGYGRVIFISSIAGLYGDKNLASYSTAKAAVIGLANVLAIEGAEHGVTANCIVPAAQTRLAEGRDTSGFPPWGSELVAPVAGWLAHEDCKSSGELYVSLAGRMAKAYMAETQGIYQPVWTIEQVAARDSEVGDRSRQMVFPPVPSGFSDHLSYSFAMAKGD